MNFLPKCAAILAFSLALLSIGQAAVIIENPDGAGIPAPQVAISPGRLELEIGKKAANGSFRLFNLGDKPIVVQANVNHWDLDENNKIRTIPPTPQSLDQWLIVNPVNFTVAPGEAQTIRVAIRPRAKPEPGEHRAIIYFNQLLQGAAKPGAIQVKFRLGAVVYGLVDKVERRAKLHSISSQIDNNSSEVLFDISSLGNASVRLNGQASIWPADRFPGTDNISDYILQGTSRNVPAAVLQISPLPTTPVLAGTRRIIRASLSAPRKTGRYILYVKGTLNDQPFSRKLELNVP